MKIAAVLIGKNEGERLIKSLDSVVGQFHQVIYVDSGSTDNSIEEAQQRGAKTVSLDITKPFTAARARNKGVAAIDGNVDYIQFLDGDCILEPAWVENAGSFLSKNDNVAAVNGILAELDVDASIYNRMCGIEWAMEPGQIDAIAGVSLFRASAFDRVGGFNPDVSAGEEGELCLRLRNKGWAFWNLDVPMARHDAAIHDFGTWWRRCVRHGKAISLEQRLHGDNPEYKNSKTIHRAFFWAAILPTLIVGFSLFYPIVSVGLVGLYILQIIRMAMKSDLGGQHAFKFSSLMMISKFAELKGYLSDQFGR